MRDSARGTAFSQRPGRRADPQLVGSGRGGPQVQRVQLPQPCPEQGAFLGAQPARYPIAGVEGAVEHPSHVAGSDRGQAPGAAAPRGGVVHQLLLRDRIGHADRPSRDEHIPRPRFVTKVARRVRVRRSAWYRLRLVVVRRAWLYRADIATRVYLRQGVKVPPCSRAGAVFRADTLVEAERGVALPAHHERAGLPEVMLKAKLGADYPVRPVSAALPLPHSLSQSGAELERGDGCGSGSVQPTGTACSTTRRTFRVRGRRPRARKMPAHTGRLPREEPTRQGYRRVGSRPVATAVRHQSASDRGYEGGSRSDLSADNRPAGRSGGGHNRLVPCGPAAWLRQA